MDNSLIYSEATEKLRRMREAAEWDKAFDGLVGEMETQRTNGECAS